MATNNVVNTGVTILHLFDKMVSDGHETWVCFRYNGRTYERKAEYSGFAYMYNFTFKRKLWTCYGRRLYT